MAPELSSLEKDVHEVEKEIRELKGDVDERIKAQTTKEDSHDVKTTY